jgi:hypothetical protein
MPTVACLDNQTSIVMGAARGPGFGIAKSLPERMGTYRLSMAA